MNRWFRAWLIPACIVLALLLLLGPIRQISVVTGQGGDPRKPKPTPTPVPSTKSSRPPPVKRAEPKNPPTSPRADTSSSPNTTRSAETTMPRTAYGELHFKAPDGWLTEKPSSAMRAAQYKLPKAEGDSEDASLVLYYFGTTQGGSPQVNIDRWKSQIQQADGASNKAKTETMMVNGLKVTTVDVSGTYTAEMAPGTGNRRNDANYRLRGAVIETPKGNYFLKLVGPASTVGRWERAFTDYLKSFEFK